ncbi:unnamed protein product, partial [Owenia fusiformis]
MKIIFVLAAIQLLQIKGAFGQATATADVSCQKDVDGHRSIHIQLNKESVNIAEAYAFNKKTSCPFTLDANGGATIDIDLAQGHLSQQYEDCGIVEDATVGVSNIFKFSVISTTVLAPIIVAPTTGVEVYVYAIVCDFNGVSNTATVNGITIEDSALAAGTVTVANPNPTLQLLDASNNAVTKAAGETLDMAAIPSIQIQVTIDTSQAVGGMRVVKCTAYAGADTTGQSLRLSDREGCGTDQYANAIGIPEKDTGPVFPGSGYSDAVSGKYSGNSIAFPAFKFLNSNSVTFECVVIMCTTSEITGSRTGNCEDPACSTVKRKRRQAVETDSSEIKKIAYATFNFDLGGSKRGQ